MKTRDVVAWGGTLVLGCVAVYLLWGVYERSESSPWTRDGQVEADITLISAQVSAPVREVLVSANQMVSEGQILFRLEPSLFRNALDGARAALTLAEAREAAQEHLVRRLSPAGSLMEAEEALRQAKESLTLARAERQKAQAALGRAELEYGFTEVRAPASGHVMGISLEPGAMVSAGQPLFSLIVQDSFRITGFFRETLLRDIEPGREAEVTLMAYPELPLRGVVRSIDWGIARNDGSPGENLLPRVTPTFDWIRLAQRVPVNIRLTQVPEQVQLRVGLTASVAILPNASTETR